MKKLSNKALLLILVLLSGYGYITSCSHKNEAVPEPATKTVAITRGTDILSPGALTKGNAAEFKLDKAHSSVMWSTNYVGAAGLLTGRFNQFGVHDVTDPKMINYTTTGQPLLDSSWAFYENEPAKTYFNGYVQINTSNTGEPGRDAGCLLGTFGTATGKTTEAENIAKIKSKSIELSTTDKGYIVKCDLTFHGITKEVTAKMNYTGQNTFPAGYAGATALTLAGLSIEFQILAKTDFAIVSNSIADKVTIKCNGQFKKS